MITLFSAILVLGILIFVHELGHFIFAKWAGVKVITFSLGFGPKLISFVIGDTEYRLSMIPLGGFVRMLGEHSNEGLTFEDSPFIFIKKPVKWRLAIASGGPVANFIFAIILYYSIILIWGLPILSTEVGDIIPGEPAALAGVIKGDLIVAVDGYPVERWGDLSSAINKKSKILRLTLIRNGQKINYTIQPREVKVKDIFGDEHQIYRIGIISSGEIITQRVGPIAAVRLALEKSYLAAELIIFSIAKLFQGKIPLATLGGPIQIGEAAGKAVRHGLVEFLIFMAILSINLAVLNLLPIPTLDGGHIFFFILEGITRSPVPAIVREKAQQVGMIFLILVMGIIIYNDIIKLISGLTK